MSEWTFPENEDRQEIAETAARLIAEMGYDFSTARKKALRELFGHEKLPRDLLPSNEEIEDALREYQALFQADTHPHVLRKLREVALYFMENLAHFEPIVYGGVVNGTAGEHSDVHLVVFPDNPKELDYALLNEGIDFDPGECQPAHGLFAPSNLFVYKGVGVEIGVLEPQRRHGLLKPGQDGRVFRTDLAGLRRLMASESNQPVPHNPKPQE